MARGAEDELDELGEAERRLEERRAACRQLQQELEAARAEKDAARSACLAGVDAARTQMARMRAELGLLRQLASPAAAAEGPGPADGGGSVASSLAMSQRQTDEEQSRQQDLQVQARTLRYELSKWRHQVEQLEEERRDQEEELSRLRAQLTHAHDVLESTRHAVRHHEVERNLRESGLVPLSFDGAGEGEPPALSKLNRVPLLGGGHSSIEAKAERCVRERTDKRAGVLAGKAQRLTGVVSSQQLLIQRLEKELLKEEDVLERRQLQLASESRRHLHLKGALRRRSDGVVAAALGVPGRCPGLGGGVQKSSSVSQLPLIDERH